VIDGKNNEILLSNFEILPSNFIIPARNLEILFSNFVIPARNHVILGSNFAMESKNGPIPALARWTHAPRISDPFQESHLDAITGAGDRLGEVSPVKNVPQVGKCCCKM